MEFGTQDCLHRLEFLRWYICYARHANWIQFVFLVGNGVRRYKSLVFFFYFLSQIKEVWVKEKLFEEDWQPDGCLLFSSIQGCISGEYKLHIKFYLIIKIFLLRILYENFINQVVTNLNFIVLIDIR